MSDVKTRPLRNKTCMGGGVEAGRSYLIGYSQNEVVDRQHDSVQAFKTVQLNTSQSLSNNKLLYVSDKLLNKCIFFNICSSFNLVLVTCS